MAIERIFVVGMGTMGHGIAQACAQAGYSVTVKDSTRELAEKGVARIGKSLGGMVAKGKITQEDQDKVMGRITVADDYAAAAAADLAVEAVFEKLEVKKETFASLDRVMKPGAIMASNTSATSITLIATATGRPESVIGTHFFNPAPVMKLVEIVRGLVTSEETLQATRDFVISLGKTPVVAKDRPGFAIGRIYLPCFLEAVRCLEEGISSVADIDTGMKLGYNMPMGPLEMGDLVGLDVMEDASLVLWEGFGDIRYKPPFLLTQMVQAGHLGRKAGKGFYDYNRK